LAVVGWVLVHESGVHATVAGVLLALTVPVVRNEAAGGPDAGPGLAGLIVGKVIGITASAAIVARFTRAELGESLTWLDVVGVALLGGIGFTVSLLIGELAFGLGSERDEHVKVGVLTGSLLPAAMAAVLLRVRERTYRHMAAREAVARSSGGRAA